MAAQVALLLMQSIATHVNGARCLERAGLFPVLVAAMRADEPLLREQGLSLLAALADVPELVPALVQAGLAKLVCFLARSCTAGRWAWLVDILGGLLATPHALPAPHRRQLLNTLAPASECVAAGEMRLKPHVAAGLRRAVGVLRALELVAPRPVAVRSPDRSP